MYKLSELCHAMNKWLNIFSVHMYIMFFFVLFLSRYPESDSHGFILDFLLSEAAVYAKAGKAGTFLLDLMKLDVPKLFACPPHSTSESFKKNLHSYFANDLSRELQKNVESIMVSQHIILAFKL